MCLLLLGGHISVLPATVARMKYALDQSKSSGNSISRLVGFLVFSFCPFVIAFSVPFLGMRVSKLLPQLGNPI